MKEVAAGEDRSPAFSAFMDRCLVCRACEDVCPSHVPFGRMMEAAREQIEPTRTRRSRFVHWLGFHWLLPHPSLIRIATALQPVLRPILPARLRAMVPERASPLAALPRVTDPPGFEVRGTVALLAGCVQDRWFHHVNLATIRVLSRAGWRVTVPRGQACCGALAAHNGRLAIARRLARRARHAFADADVVVVNAAGCGAHMQTYEELLPGTALPVIDLMAFLAEHGLGETTLHPLPRCSRGSPGSSSSRSETATVAVARPGSMRPRSRRWPARSAAGRPSPSRRPVPRSSPRPTLDAPCRSTDTFTRTGRRSRWCIRWSCSIGRSG
jgi:glycolate oxidase iron-sulfur subunit